MTTDEIVQLQGMAKKLLRQRYIRGAVPVLLFLVAVTGIAIAADGRRWAWLIVVGGTIAFFFGLNWANQAETLGLLFRRSLRVGKVDHFERSIAPISVRRAYGALAEIEDEDGPAGPVGDYWLNEERFEERIAKVVKRQPERFETPIDDDVILMIDGRWVNKIINAPSVSCES